MINFSKLSLGSVQWGRSYGLSNIQGQTKSNEVAKILSKARSEGIHVIDTASSYGNAEEILGKHNLSYFSIVTKTLKLGNKIITKSEIDKLIYKFEQSLLRLNVSSCYALLIHQKDDVFKKGNEYLIEAVNELKTKRLIKKIGISVYESDDIIEITEKLKPDIVQLPLNVLDQRFIQDGSLNYLKSNNIEVHARSVFLQGLLLMPSKKIPTYFKRWSKKLKEWNQVCFENKINNLDAALNFVFKQNNVDYCLVGVENLEQLEQCVFAIKNSQDLDVTKLACRDKELLNPFNWKI